MQAHRGLGRGMGTRLSDLTEEIIGQVSERGFSSRDEAYEIAESILRQRSLGRYIPVSVLTAAAGGAAAALCGADVLEPLLEDPDVDEIMVMGASKIYTERHGRLCREDTVFGSDERLMNVIRRMAERVDRRVNESSPIADLRMSDGSRVNVVLPPICPDGPVVTIRKFSEKPFTLAKLCEIGTITDGQAAFLRDAVTARKNIFVSGGTGTGKTTMLNALSREIPEGERVVTIEDSAELRFGNVDNLVRLECRTSNVEGRGEISLDDLIRTALRMRPDRIIVGEVRGREAVSMLQAMNTGHSGSMSTGHANSAADMLTRLETMVLMGLDVPLEAVRQQISSAIDYIVHLDRMPDHTRKVTEIGEIISQRGKNTIRRIS